MHDAHVHLLDLAEPLSAMQHAHQAGVKLLLCATTCIAELEKAHALAKQAPEGLRVIIGLGLHPQQDVATLRNDLPYVLEKLDNYTLLSEIGLDGGFEPEHLKLQESVLQQILRAAQGKPRILSLHAKGASQELNQTVPDLLDPKWLCIWHWFSGNATQLNTALDWGAHFSINPAMAHSHSTRKLLRLIPPQRVFLETDAPYAPLRITGQTPRPATSADLPMMIQRFASLWSWPQSKVRDHFEEQTERLADHCNSTTNNQY